MRVCVSLALAISPSSKREDDASQVSAQRAEQPLSLVEHVRSVRRSREDKTLAMMPVIRVRERGALQNCHAANVRL